MPRYALMSMISRAGTAVHFITATCLVKDFKQRSDGFRHNPSGDYSGHYPYNLMKRFAESARVHANVFYFSGALSDTPQCSHKA